MLFQRLANNFIKFGYFPTDSETLRRILNALAPAETGNMTLFDPTAGEGVALAECKHHLGQDRTCAYGVEIDEPRAWHAKTLLDHCIHGDLMDCLISPRSFGLVFFNPPYGDLSADKSNGQVAMEGRARLEKLYYRRVIGTLQKQGVMVMIIPHYALDKAFATWIAHHLSDVKVYLAATQQYKQIVVFGVKMSSKDAQTLSKTREQLMRIGEGKLPEPLTDMWVDKLYVVPAAQTKHMQFAISQLDVKQLAEVIETYPCLWTQFQSRFEQAFVKPRRPLMDLSQWHLALALAVGQVSGAVKNQDGRVYLIRGDTHKVQQERVQVETDETGAVVETRTRLDRFQPALRALDMTPNSPTLGQVLIIQ